MKNTKRILLGISVASVLAWIAVGVVFECLGGYEKISKLGTLGDYFGGMLNPVFSFMALISLLYTIHIQSEELRLSRNELELTRRELAVSSESLKRQADHFEKETVRQDIHRIIDRLVARINRNFNENRLGGVGKNGSALSIHYVLKNGIIKSTNPELAWVVRQFNEGNVDVVKTISWINDDLERLIVYIKEYESVHDTKNGSVHLRKFYQDEFSELIQFLRYVGNMKDYVFSFYNGSDGI